jgi:hypothetical protein
LVNERATVLVVEKVSISNGNKKQKKVQQQATVPQTVHGLR